VTPGGIGTSQVSFTVIPLPTITGFNPAFGPIGTVITVTGTNLDRSSLATINRIKANLAVVSESKVKVFVPNDATSGPLTLMTAYGFCETSTCFEVIAASAVTGISPPAAPAGGFVIIKGWGFKGVSSVHFGELLSPSVAVNSTNQITAQIPYGAKSSPVMVEVPAGTAYSSRPMRITLSITSIEPRSGTAGTQVEISGVGLSSITKVDFGGTEADFKINSDTSITATAPPTGANGPIHVTSRAYSTYSLTKYLYPPTIVSIKPESGSAGTLVAIEIGKNIDLGVEECLIEFPGTGRLTPSYVDLLDHVVYVAVPREAKSGNIRLIVGSGEAQSAGPFMVTES
jgi:hypothetical protein